VLKQLKSLLFLVIIVIIVYLVKENAQEIITTLHNHTHTLIYAIALSGATLAFQVTNFLSLLPMTNSPSFIKTYHIWALANLTNYLGPFQPGLAVRVAYFKSENIPLSVTLQTTLRQLVLSTWIALGLAGAGLFSEQHTIKEIGIGSLIIFIITPFFIRFLVAHPIKFSIFDRISLALKNFNPSFKQLLLVSGQYLCSILNIYVVYHLYGASLAFNDAVLLAVITALSTLLALTPNNVGVQDLLLGYAAHLGGLSTADSISIVLLFRIAHIAACILIYLLTLRKNIVQIT